MVPRKAGGLSGVSGAQSLGPAGSGGGEMVGRVVVSAFAEAARAKKKFSSEPFPW